MDGTHFGELFDFWGGLSDIESQIIRVLHSLSFVDDPTRMLRAIRFEQRFGFRIEDRTLQLMLDAKGLLGNISGDRIRHEINLIFEESKKLEILSRLAELDLLTAIHPSLPWDQSIYVELSKNINEMPPEEWGSSIRTQLSSDRRSFVYLIWLSHLQDKDVESVCKRLRLSESMKKNIQAIIRIIETIPKMVNNPPSQIFKELEEISLIAIFVASLRMDTCSVEILEKYVQTWKKISPKTTGNDLRERGIPPGQIYQRVLDGLRSAWLDGEIKSTEEEIALLEDILKSEL